MQVPDVQKVPLIRTDYEILFTPTLFTVVPVGHAFLYGSVTDVQMGLFSRHWLGYCVSHRKSCCVEVPGLSEDSGSHLQSGLPVLSTLRSG